MRKAGAMRAPVIALLCGLAAVAALLAWRGGAEHPAMQASLPAVAPASPALPVPVPDLQPAARPPEVAAASSPPLAAPVAPKPPLPAARPVRSAFALSSEHQALIQETLLAAADHELLEREPRDDGWATDAERLIRQALARHARAGDFELVAVDCRQSLCAVQAFSYGEAGQRAWVKAIDELYKQTLASSFDSVNTAFPNQGSRSAVLTFLHRRAATPP